MISLEDMTSLFKLISAYLKKDIKCYAFGGNAMMYYGYKGATKDVDIIFEDERSKSEFVSALKELGYSKTSLVTIYSEKHQKDKNKPEIYTKGDERFYIFVRNIFLTKLSKAMTERTYGRFDFIMKENTLSVMVLSKEDIILLKSVTNREKDFDDILNIIEKENNINWGLIVDEAIWQGNHGDKRIILDLEETMQRLKEKILIKKELFDRLSKSI
ncbi:hypothetical protein J4459_02265 [Candidatus Woesearchaeota archaeon]|nr:hypothetical protein [Candidatus Woesearchaeota archaeon]